MVDVGLGRWLVGDDDVEVLCGEWLASIACIVWSQGDALIIRLLTSNCAYIILTCGLGRQGALTLSRRTSKSAGALNNQKSLKDCVPR